MFSSAQSQILSNLNRSPTAVHRSTSVVGIQILLLAPMKAHSSSIVATDRVSSNPTKVKAVTVSLRGVFRIEGCAYVTWTSPGFVVLVSSAKSSNFVHTHLNLETSSLSKHINSWTKQNCGCKIHYDHVQVVTTIKHEYK